MVQTFSAVLFDFDGLIVDTEQPIYDAYRAIFAELGVTLTIDVWSQVIGGSGHRDVLFDYLESVLGHGVDRDTIRETARNHHHNQTEQLPAREGVAEHIEQAKLAGLKLAVASSSTRAWVTGHLDRLGLLSSFDVICTREDVQQTKPHPEIYELALTRLSLSAERTFAIEDSPNGVTAAKSAGIQCVVVPNPITVQMAIGHADLHLESLGEMSHAELVSALRGGVSPTAYEKT